MSSGNVCPIMSNFYILNKILKYSNVYKTFWFTYFIYGASCFEIVWQPNEIWLQTGFFNHCYVASVVSDSVWPHGLQPTRLFHPLDFPGNSTGVGCHCLLLFNHRPLVFYFLNHKSTELSFHLLELMTSLNLHIYYYFFHHVCFIFEFMLLDGIYLIGYWNYSFNN